MKNIRTRFAPSPTGLMHIGNIRTALLNYIFALKNNGTPVLRIEDTDPKRNFDPGAKHILSHLQWLGLNFEEGPNKGGPYAPYFQSQRNEIYQKHLKQLMDTNFIYRCFCTQEELEIKRQRQIAMKKPPRYDGTCKKLTPEQTQEKINKQTPFVWRMKVDHSQQISFQDLARKTLTFDLKNFSDFPVTREDGSFTFMFANCIDDMEMKITHVLRGEDHLTNTVGQVVLLQALSQELPVFWHLSILCNQDGKKLSKRDQGFSLEDVKAAGFLPEAICNYLGIIGGSFKKEVLSIKELVEAYNFDNIHTTSQIRYDLEKLRWLNHKWIAQYEISKLAELCRPYLEQAYDTSTLTQESLECLVKAIHTDINTLDEVTQLLQFYFKQPTITKEQLHTTIEQSKAANLLNILKAKHASWQEFSEHIKTEAKKYSITNKELFSSIRLLLTGSAKGLQIHDLYSCLGSEEFFKRLLVIPA